MFLDEIATISPTTQVRLLRVLQERELERVGGEETIPVDVRIIVATNTPADTLLGRGSFREDLFYRLHVIPVTIPPLRERSADIPVLVRHFIDKLRDRTCSPVRAVAEPALARLMEYHWPGNVREIENVVERALVMAEGDVLQATDLPTLAGNGETAAAPDDDLPPGGMDLTRVVEGMEERLLRQALSQARGVKAEAARLLGLKPSALY